MAHLTPSEEFTAEMTRMVLDGNHPEVAAIASGISRSLFFQWRKKGVEGEEPFASWWMQITRAVAKSETDLVHEARYSDESPALKLLAPRFPSRWSPQIKVEMTDQINKFLDAAQRVCPPEVFRLLLAELAEESDAGGYVPPQLPTVQ